MWRLFISDLRNRWLDWVGIILVAFFCGVASGWSALLISSSYGLEGAASRQLLNAGTATLFLTWIASIPVSASVARLVAKKKRAILLCVAVARHAQEICRTLLFCSDSNCFVSWLDVGFHCFRLCDSLL